MEYGVWSMECNRYDEGGGVPYMLWSLVMNGDIFYFK